MHAPPIKAILSTVGIPAGVLAATAIPSVAVANDTVASHPDVNATSWWRPPVPCVAVQAGVYPVGAGFCPGTTGGLDWHSIATKLRDDDERAGDSEATIIWDETRQPITVELLTPTDRSIDAATIGLDVTLSGELADQLATGDPPHLVMWITMATPADVQPAGQSPEIAECAVVHRSTDDFVPGSRRMPQC